jgi:hypothetical protein
MASAPHPPSTSARADSAVGLAFVGTVLLALFACGALGVLATAEAARRPAAPPTRTTHPPVSADLRERIFARFQELVLLRQIALRERDPLLLGSVYAPGARPGRRPRRDRPATPRRAAPARPAAAGQDLQRLPARRRALGGDRPHAPLPGHAGDRAGHAAADRGGQRRRVPLHPGQPRRPLGAVALHLSPCPTAGHSRYRRVALVARMRLAAARAADSSSPPPSTSARSTLASARRHTVAPHQCISG